MSEWTRGTLSDVLSFSNGRTSPERAKGLARFSDVSEKQFSSLGTNRERIRRYLEEAMT